MKLLRHALLACSIWLGLVGTAAAHPHIFVEQHIEVVFDGHNVTGLRMIWRFDELYSSMLRYDYTYTKKGPLTTEDIANLHDHAFANLASVHYFTTVSLNGKPVALGEPKEFTASFNADEKAIYSFLLPLKLPMPGAKNLLEVAVFDPEYYVDFELAADHPVTSNGGETMNANCQPGTVKRATQGWGDVDADIVSCAYQRGT